MKRGDKCVIKRGPLAGMLVELKRHDEINRSWHGVLQTQRYVHGVGAVAVLKPPPGEVMVWDYELTDERKGR